MSPENFAYWLHGMLEDGKHETLDKAQLTMVREHLALVFAKVTSGPSTELRPPLDERAVRRLIFEHAPSRGPKKYC